MAHKQTTNTLNDLFMSQQEKSTMITLEELMETSVESLAEKQHCLLKQHVLTTLASIADLIKDEKYREIGTKLAYSPSGDSMGCENMFINFQYRTGKDQEPLDIEQVVLELLKLKSIN